MDFIAKYGSFPGGPRPPARRWTPTTRRSRCAWPVTRRSSTSLKRWRKSISASFLSSAFIPAPSAPACELYNADRNSSERIGQIYLLNGRERKAVDELRGGDIGAVVKLKDTHTGNTLGSSARPVRLPKVEYPRPTIHASLIFSVKGEEDKVAAGLAALHEEDPTFLHRVDSELHQTIISAQGELHLEVVVERLRRRFNVHVELGEPRIPFRETIAAPADSRYRHKKQTGGAGQFAEVWMKIEPLPRDSGVDFTESLTGQNVDRVFVPSVEEGVQNACREGILAGYKVVDVKIDFLRRQNAPGGLQGHRLPDRRLFRLQGSLSQGPPLPARTHSPGRGAAFRKTAWAKSWATSPAAAAASWALTPTACSR